MITYACKVDRSVLFGGFVSVCNWGSQQVAEHSTTVATIYRMRGGEKEASVVAEITSDGIYPISKGRYVKVRKLHKLSVS